VTSRIPEPSDEDLAQRIRDGDENARATLIDRYLERLRARVRRRLPALVRRKVAESDVIQEAWLTAFLRLEQFQDRGEGSFRRWIDRILSNKVRDEVRRYLGTAKRSARERSHGAEGGGPAEAPARAPSPSSHAAARERRADVLRVIEELPESHRELLRLIHGAGLSQKEVALRTGRAQPAVRKAYGRALEAFRKRFGEPR
jgi:RNA polymerase sigma-70 factor (ECF subfamily)